jgi:hypothetical protein
MALWLATLFLHTIFSTSIFNLLSNEDVEALAMAPPKGLAYFCFTYPFIWIPTFCSILCSAEQIDKGSTAVLACFSSIGAMWGLAFAVFVKKGRASWWGYLGRLIWLSVGIVTVLGLVVVVPTAWKDCWEWEQLVMEERNRG